MEQRSLSNKHVEIATVQRSFKGAFVDLLDDEYGTNAVESCLLGFGISGFGFACRRLF